MAVFVYPAIIHQEKGTFGLVFPDLPGCVTIGESQGELAQNAAEALGLHLSGMMEDDLPLPTPSDIATMPLNREEGDIATTLVTAWATPPKLSVSA